MKTGNPTLDELCKLREDNGSALAMLKKAEAGLSVCYDVDVYPSGSMALLRDEIREFLNTAGLDSCKIATSRDSIVTAFVDREARPCPR